MRVRWRTIDHGGAPLPRTRWRDTPLTEEGLALWVEAQVFEAQEASAPDSWTEERAEAVRTRAISLREWETHVQVVHEGSVLSINTPKRLAWEHGNGFYEHATGAYGRNAATFIVEENGVPSEVMTDALLVVDATPLTPDSNLVGRRVAFRLASDYVPVMEWKEELLGPFTDAQVWEAAKVAIEEQVEVELAARGRALLPSRRRNLVGNHAVWIRDQIQTACVGTVLGVSSDGELLIGEDEGGFVRTVPMNAVKELP